MAGGGSDCLKSGLQEDCIGVLHGGRRRVSRDRVRRVDSDTIVFGMARVSYNDFPSMIFVCLNRLQLLVSDAWFKKLNASLDPSDIKQK